MPHIVIVDWEMPLIDGVQFVRVVRSPLDFPAPTSSSCELTACAAPH